MLAGMGWRGLAAGLAVLALGGCGAAGPGTYNVVVSMDEGLRNPTTKEMPSVEVDVVAVSEGRAQQWRSYQVGKYFSGNDAFRRDEQASARAMKFTNDASGAQTVAKSDGIWKNPWKGATSLFVLANVPGVRGDETGDPRKLELPLLKDRWDGNTIEIIVQRSGVKNKTPIKPPAP